MRKHSSRRGRLFTAKRTSRPSLRVAREVFETVNGRYVLNPELRRAVIFGRHDLVQDAPMSHLDLLVCRNTLMYFNAETQARILGRFNYAINPGGLLFLGKAEMLLLYSSLYAPVRVETPNLYQDRASQSARTSACASGKTEALT